MDIVESGAVDYIVITGVGRRNTAEAYITLNRQALLNQVACLTSLDTANALADIIASRYTQLNTELVDIAHLREKRQQIAFSKMEGSGNDYIFINNFYGEISCPNRWPLPLPTATSAWAATASCSLSTATWPTRACASLPGRLRGRNGRQLHPLRG